MSDACHSASLRSYEDCSRTDQRRQEVSGCSPRPHFGLNPGQGRGAPEIDLLEVMPGDGWLPWGLKKPYYSTSLQLAPAAKIRPFNGAKPLPGAWYEGLEYGGNATQTWTSPGTWSQAQGTLVFEVTQGAAEHIFARRTSIDPLAEETHAIRSLPVSVALVRARDFMSVLTNLPFPLHA